MQIRTIKEALEASVIAGEDKLETVVEHVYASDLMSDVLAFGRPNSILFTVLATQQAVISAHMAEFKAVVFLRGKKSKDGSHKFAQDNNMALLSTRFDMYDACVRIDSVQRGIVPVPAPASDRSATRIRRFRGATSSGCATGSSTNTLELTCARSGTPCRTTFRN